MQELLQAERGPLPLPQLLTLAEVSRASIDRMLAEGLLDSWQEPVDPAEDPFDVGYAPPAHEINPEQDHALKRIRARFELGEFGVQLLYGVTGSGKTEVYLRAIQETLARQKTALVLVPEIALTLWIGRQCRAWFGARFEGVAVLHSALSDVERAREWWRVRNGKARVVVGTRSAVFAPLERLGLIIVDEEQENSYKQEETPRYHGRDVAIVRAKMENAVALLGSATPSLETYHHAALRKIRTAHLASRVENRSLANVRNGRPARRVSADPPGRLHLFDAALRHPGMFNQWNAGAGAHQSPRIFLVGAVPQLRRFGAVRQLQHLHDLSQKSESAGVPLLRFRRGGAEGVPKCDSKYVYFFGEGSEHLEERLRKEFPAARIARLDRDTTRTKRQYQQTLGAFAAGALDILVGTQMLAKGHDFQRVTLVGVVSADALLSMPDFRAAERTFQLLTQVAGRAGRGELHGRVLIQTFYPEHYAIQDAVKQDYTAFFEREMNFRRTMAYPPFTSLANVIVRDTSLEKAIRWSRELSEYFLAVRRQRSADSWARHRAARTAEKRISLPVFLKSPKRAVLTRLLTGALDYCEAEKKSPTPPCSWIWIR